MALPQNRHADQQDETGDSRINPHSCGHLSFSKGIKICWKKIFCSTNVIETNWISIYRRMKLDYSSNLAKKKIDSKWIKRP